MAIDVFAEVLGEIFEAIRAELVEIYDNDPGEPDYKYHKRLTNEMPLV